ncbi:hypothetical protein AUK40_03305 [Candidatus Wirthbacteria bacterium CG2_30_54_11]|uniref:Methyltransferase domain-containing protein n=1 Tax=Candidatus Wirthbacteria bacterium CG2_30_54_11 TaxID=1817892 RepID=A0A1J5IW58_9BACT|nr:MAG: hypothetical protein AUK40_03305 [Candidatus Wirthbacteria bacterium CG2_30_54_11]
MTEHKNSKSIQNQIDQIRWFHEFDFGGGLKAVSREPDVEDHRRIWQFIEQQIDKVDLHGKTVLDVGCFDGYFSFLSERRGARSVLATDDFSQNWSDSSGLRLARELLKSSVEINDHLSIYDISSLKRTFDVIFCFGVYYHLLDPFYALAQLRQVCHEDSVVLLEGDIWVGEQKPLVKYQLGQSTHPTFLPTRQTLESLLNAAFFRVESVVYRRPINPLKNSIKHLLGRECKERALISVRPFHGLNSAHEYPPPFGLPRYLSS